MMATKKKKSAPESLGRFIVGTHTAAALWECEILGQLSDGTWENSAPRDHYRPWFHLETVVIPGEARVDAPTAHFPKTNYNLTRLLDLGADCPFRHEIRDRMIASATMRLALI